MHELEKIMLNADFRLNSIKCFVEFKVYSKDRNIFGCSNREEYIYKTI